MLAGVAQWFTAERAALSMSLLFSVARVGSYMADLSPRWAAPLYAAGWRPPLILAAAITGASLLAATALGVAFSVVPAVIWPATAMLAPEKRLGTAYGLINVLQSSAMFACNWAAGALNDAFHAGPQNPAGYTPMLIMFGALSLVALASTLALWARERGPHAQGLERPGRVRIALLSEAAAAEIP